MHFLLYQVDIFKGLLGGVISSIHVGTKTVVLLHVCVCSVVSDSFYPMDYRAQGYSALGILQERILEWVAISPLKGSSWNRD